MTTYTDEIKRLFIDTSAWIALMNKKEQHYVDAFSIAIIQSRPDIDAIFAFDHHMALAGIPVLPGLLNSKT